MSFLEANGLTVGYDSSPIVKNLIFSLEKGEILTFLGPNGAGKSTILKTIAGELPPISGELTLDSVSLFSMSAKERAKKIAVLLTEPFHAERMTCFDVVSTGRYPYTGWFGKLGAEDLAITEKAMRSVDLTALADRDFHAISDGQRQRVLLARALAQEPELLLLDEPASYLDLRYKSEFYALLERMAHKDGLSVILSSHDLPEISRISDRVVFVRDDGTAESGKARDLLTKENIRALFSLDASVPVLFDLPPDATIEQ